MFTELPEQIVAVPFGEIFVGSGLTFTTIVFTELQLVAVIVSVKV